MPARDLADALVALARGNRDSAADQVAAVATENPSSRLARALDAHLSGSDVDSVYESTAAFTDFIEGGSNVSCYERVIELIGAIHAEVRPETVADIGCGDGRVTAAVLTGATSVVDLIEPSPALLAEATDRLRTGSVETRSHRSGVTEFLAARPEVTWDLVQSTYALHTLPPPERVDVLAILAGRCRRVIIAEFDVPSFEDRSVEHAMYAATVYERGLAEYPDGDLVAQGFLMPVLVGQFDPDQPRHTFEQPIDSWVADLLAAGFKVEATTPICDYWWAPAVLIEARV